jgi:hypothetical protein
MDTTASLARYVYTSRLCPLEPQVESFPLKLTKSSALTYFQKVASRVDIDEVAYLTANPCIDVPCDLHEMGEEVGLSGLILNLV